MYETERLRVEKEVAVARRALYRALETCERAQDFGLEEDLRAINVELARIMSDLMSKSRRA